MVSTYPNFDWSGYFGVAIDDFVLEIFKQKLDAPKQSLPLDDEDIKPKDKKPCNMTAIELIQAYGITKKNADIRVSALRLPKATGYMAWT